MINTSTWTEFRVGDLFDIHPTKAYKLTNAQLLDDGDYPVIANSAYNNGIGGYSTKEPTEKGNMVTFSDTVDANTIFYQPNDFVGYPHVQGLYPLMYEDKWNEYTYSFFVSVFRGSAISKGFDYGNKFRRDIAVDLIIKLPATSDGQPDWNYMESYMKDVMEETEKSIENLKKVDDTKNLIDTSEWKEFRVGDLFEQDRGKEKSPKQAEDGNCMLISETNISNGYTKEVKPTKIFKGNCLTVSVNYAETVFYQPDDFCASVNIMTLRNEHLNRYNGLFLATRLAVNNRKYNYINKISKDLLNNTYLSLPATEDGEPDWAYMEDYMKQIEQKAAKKLELFHKEKIV